jgi:hypothetical protein
LCNIMSLFFMFLIIVYVNCLWPSF